MSVKEKIERILEEQYGISTPGELDEALQKQQKVDISPFVLGNFDRKEQKRDGDSQGSRLH